MEEEVDESEFVMEGRVVKKSDVHNMLHFTKLVNLMDDKTGVKFYHEINSIKAGKVKISKKTIQETNCTVKL